MRPKPTNILTVTIRNDSPMIHCGDSPTYRSVQIKLTGEQFAAIQLRHGEEEISRCFIETECVEEGDPHV